MANHFLAIDPVLLMNEEQIAHLNKLETTGEAQDFIQEQLEDQFDFSQVFQSTNDEHDLHVHEFMLANETGERKMHKMGVMKTPSDLLSFVTVDDEWMKEHKDIVNKGVHFKMHERVDPKELKGINGQTEDGQTTSALRYAHYKPNILMVSENEKAISEEETAESMEERAKEQESMLRKREFSLDPLRFLKGKHDQVSKQTIEGALLDGFLKGWNMMDEYKAYKERDSNQRVQPTAPPKEETPKEEKPVEIGDGLHDLSTQIMQQKANESGQRL